MGVQNNCNQSLSGIGVNRAVLFVIRKKKNFIVNENPKQKILIVIKKSSVIIIANMEIYEKQQIYKKNSLIFFLRSYQWIILSKYLTNEQYK